MKRSFLAVIIGLIFLGAACQKQTVNITNTVARNNNTSTTNTNIAATIDPCTLLTRTEAEAVFGKAAKEPELKGAACRYDTADTSKFFDLTTKTGTAADFETMKSLCDNSDQAVAGLGHSSCAANNTVVVLKNNVLMTLIAGGVFDQDQLKSLAVTAASRIP